MDSKKLIAEFEKKLKDAKEDRDMCDCYDQQRYAAMARGRIAAYESILKLLREEDDVHSPTP